MNGADIFTYISVHISRKQVISVQAMSPRAHIRYADHPAPRAGTCMLFCCKRFPAGPHAHADQSCHLFMNYILSPGVEQIQVSPTRRARYGLAVRASYSCPGMKKMPVKAAFFCLRTTSGISNRVTGSSRRREMLRNTGQLRRRPAGRVSLRWPDKFATTPRPGGCHSKKTGCHAPVFVYTLSRQATDLTDISVL